jgi:hypothetical protein
MFTVAATMLMAGAIPASALAHHGHHSKHQARHHAKFRRFGDVSQPTSTTASDNAGTVQSFQNGVLTIALNDGSTVKGMVTNDTELECTSTQPSTTMHDEGDGSGDQQGSGGDDQGDNNQGDDNQGDDNQGEDQNENEAGSCSTSSLTPGTVVHEASLRIGGSGATWQKVELVS